MSDFFQERSHNTPTFTWWKRESNKADNNWHNIVYSLTLFHREWDLQKLAKRGGGEIFYKNGRG